MPKKSLASKIGAGLFHALVSLFRLLFKFLTWLFGLLWTALAAIGRSAWGVFAGFGSAAGAHVSKAARATATQAAAAAGPKPKPQALAEVSTFEGRLADFEEWLYSSKSTVGVVLGARGSGKSALGLRLLENWAGRGRRAFAMGFSGAGLPAWIETAENPEAVPNNSVLLVDEGGIFFSSRDAMSNANKLLSKLLFIARHKDLSVLFISQNSANLEVNTIRQADYLLLKKPSLLQKDFERGKIKDIYEGVAGDFKKLAAHPGLTYVYSDAFRGFAANALPSFWTEKTSKAFGKTELRR